jgi:hypothetical protein
MTDILESEKIDQIALSLSARFWELLTDHLSGDMVNSIDVIHDRWRSQLSLEELEEYAVKLFDNEDLRKQLSIKQTYLYMDLYQIIDKVWSDLLAEKDSELEAALVKQRISIRAIEEELRLIREVELSKVELERKKKSEDWDIFLYRLKTTKLHIIAAVLIAIGSFGLGQYLNLGARNANHTTIFHTTARTH